MKSIFINIVLNVVIIASGFCQSNDDYLVKIFKGEYDQLGVPCGYVNISGDTVIPIGKYSYCYTDTLKSFAIVINKGGKMIGIDRNEKELFEVYVFDNGPDYVEDGLFRIIKNGKIGYSDINGNIVIAPQFDCAFPFENGKAKVSFDCKKVLNGEYTESISDNWVYINKSGQIIK